MVRLRLTLRPSLPVGEGLLKEEALKRSFHYNFFVCSELAQRACNGRFVLKIPRIYVIIKPTFVLFKRYDCDTAENGESICDSV